MHKYRQLVFKAVILHNEDQTYGESFLHVQKWFILRIWRDRINFALLGCERVISFVEEIMWPALYLY